jgi:hypothetical protein
VNWMAIHGNLRSINSSGTEIISDATLPLPSFTNRNVRSESSSKKTVSDSGTSVIFSPSHVVSSRSLVTLTLIVNRSSSGNRRRTNSTLLD